MSLEKIYGKLLGNLLNPYIYYFPSSIIPEEKKGIIEKPVLKTFFDQIKYLDPNGNNYNVITIQSIYPLLSKAVILDKNMFLLLKQKRKLSIIELNFLLEKYYDTLNFFAVASKWMYTNLHSLKTELSQEVAIYFETQNLAFQNHEKAFKKYFPLYKTAIPKTIDWSHLEENEFLPMEQLATKEIEKELTSILKPKEKLGVKKNKEPAIIADKLAQRYLLETVFNVKF